MFSFEQPFWMSLGDDGQARLSLTRVAVQHGYLPRIVVKGPQENPAVHLAQDISAGGFRTVVVGPFLSFEWPGYVPQSARTRFILIGGVTPDDLPQNAVALVFDRTHAFNAAGFAAGASVRERARGEVSLALGSRIGILLNASSPLTAAETEGFVAGVAEALEGARPTVRVLADGTDRPGVKAAIEQMRAQGIEIFLLGMGSLDPWCLEVMKDVGGSAVVADWASSGAFPAQVFVSVEEDIPAGIARALARAAPDVRAVDGPVRVVAGKAREVPAAARSRLGG
jgi:basic membrane lipoprotein Med (substrate-binding protein (PBP1-ABC) superfamily)